MGALSLSSVRLSESIPDCPIHLQFGSEPTKKTLYISRLNLSFVSLEAYINDNAYFKLYDYLVFSPWL